jgi:hypothetical protein
VSPIKTSIKCSIEPKQIDTYVSKQLTNNRVCHPRLDKCLGAAIGDQGFAIDHMLVAPCVAAEVIVVIQNENLFVDAMLLAIKDCRC